MRPLPGITASWTCCPPPAPPWGTDTTTGTTWFTPTFPSSWTCPKGYRHCFLEYERRSTTPRRVRARLENYRRYFRSGYARRDHGGHLPLVLFVFETPRPARKPSMDAAEGYVDHAPFASSNLDTITQKGILSDTWLPPAPEPWERLQLRRLVKVQLFQ